MLKPSRVEVAGPAPVILIPTYIDLVTARPPERTTAAAGKPLFILVCVSPESLTRCHRRRNLQQQVSETSRARDFARNFEF